MYRDSRWTVGMAFDAVTHDPKTGQFAAQHSDMAKKHRRIATKLDDNNKTGDTREADKHFEAAESHEMAAHHYKMGDKAAAEWHRKVSMKTSKDLGVA